MASRRRIDWSEILGPGAAAPAWREGEAVRSEVAALLVACEDLFLADDPDALLRRAVELAIDDGAVGLVRAGIYLYDEPLGLMVGTWGTDLKRAVVDEHHTMFRLDEPGRQVLARARAGEGHWSVVDDCPIIVNGARDTKVVGRGWVACTPICSARAPIGMLYNDAGLTGAAVDPASQARAAVLCAVVGLLLERIRRARGAAVAAVPTSRHPVVARAARMLGEDPSRSAAGLAADLDVTPGNLARVFKAQMGVSLVDYRNGLRLERFLATVDRGGGNLLEAALAAGFGSYAQFHRVFVAVRGMPPRRYFTARSRAAGQPRTRKRTRRRGRQG